MSNRIKAHLAISLANILYGVNYTIAKGILPDYLTPIGLTLTRISSAVIMFWGVSKIFGSEKVENKDFPRIILCAVFGVTINQFLFLKGLSYGGIFCVILLVLLPVLMAWSGRYVKNLSGPYRVVGGKFALLLTIAACLLLIYLGFYQEF